MALWIVLFWVIGVSTMPVDAWGMRTREVFWLWLLGDNGGMYDGEWRERRKAKQRDQDGEQQ